MAYVREVRLRRAHQTLHQSDPSIATVATIAYQWGFTNLGRFATAHTARYGETPAATLRRTGTQDHADAVKNHDQRANRRLRPRCAFWPEQCAPWLVGLHVTAIPSDP